MTMTNPLRTDKISKMRNMKEIHETVRKMGIFFGRYFRYFFILFIFLTAYFWHQAVAPDQAVKKPESKKEKSVFVFRPDLTKKTPEKIYENFFESRTNDFFRLGVHVSTKDKEQVEVLARSSLNEILPISTWTFEPDEKGQYREVVFSTPGRYQDLIIRLKKNSEVSEMEWYDPEVFIKSFDITPLEVQTHFEAVSLAPTFYGISATSHRELFSVQNTDKSSQKKEWLFQADGDFMRSLEFSGKINGGGRQEYAFELFRYNSVTKEKESAPLQRMPFVLDALNGMRIFSGNFLLPFSSPLKHGEWYVLDFVGPKNKDPENFFSLGELEKAVDPNEFKQKGDLFVHIGQRARLNGADSFPDGAKLEDLGKKLLYTFELRHDPVDYDNLYEASQSIIFDRERKIITGSQTTGEYLMYRFETGRPFEVFTLDAQQDGDDLLEIRLEYSLDKENWKEVPFAEELPGRARFLLTLPGNRVAKTVYVKATYIGEDKSSGFFGFNEFSVHASVSKLR